MLCSFLSSEPRLILCLQPPELLLVSHIYLTSPAVASDLVSPNYFFQILLVYLLPYYVLTYFKNKIQFSLSPIIEIACIDVYLQIYVIYIYMYIIQDWKNNLYIFMFLNLYKECIFLL